VACTDNTYYGGFDSKEYNLDKTVDVLIRVKYESNKLTITSDKGFRMVK